MGDVKKAAVVQDKSIPGPKPLPADGGWGWFVLVGATMTMMFIPATITTFGVLVPELKRKYNASTAEISWIPAISCGVWNFTAPWAAGCLKIYSHRRLTIFGTVVLVIGLIVAAFADSLLAIYISFGLLAGIGISFGSQQGILIVQEYFLARRPIANGIMLAGASVGQMIVPIILQLCLTEYGVAGTLLLLSGIAMQGIVAGALFQPSRWHMRYPDAAPEAHQYTKVPTSDPQKTKHVEAEGGDDSDDEAEIKKRNFDLAGSLVDMHNMGSLHSLSQMKAEELKQKRSKIPASSRIKPAPRPIWLCWLPHFPPYNSIFDFKLVKNLFFVIFTITTSFGRFIYQEVNILVPPMAREMGVAPGNAAVLLSILAASDTVARLVVPVLSEKIKAKVSRTQIYASNFVLKAIACFGLAFSTDYISIAIFCFLYGIGMGGNTGISMIIMAENLGLEKLPLAFALSLSFNAIIFLAGVPLIGGLRDSTNSYQACFLVMGALCAGCFILWFVFPLVKWCKNRQDSEQN